MAQEVYNIQRTSDGKTLQGSGGNPNSFSNPNDSANWTNSNLETNFRITVDYTRDFKQDYGIIEYYIDQLPTGGEIYRLNPVYVQE
jgi:hypothetical protein